METKTTAHQIANILLEVGAIQLSPKKPFTWASGWKSPIYCDNRLALSFPQARSVIKQKLAEAIKQHFPDVECIGGVATAGIPQGALVADLLDIPFIYVRSKPKGHGMENMIEGKIVPGQKVVVLEDLVSSGGSSLKAASDLKKAGFEVLGMVAIFTYGFDVAAKNFTDADIKLVCLSNYNALLELALQNKMIDDDQLDTLNDWRKDPSVWS